MPGGRTTHRARTATLAALALVVTLVGTTAGRPADAHEGHEHEAAAAVTLPSGFSDVEAIGDVTEPISVAFAPDGTAFIALKTGVVKSFDWTGNGFEPNATASDVVTTPLTTEVNNYWDRGLTGITVDPQFPTRPYVYLNYTYNKDPRGGSVPAWGDPAQQYDECPTPASNGTGPGGCLVMDRVTRITVARDSLGYVMTPGSEKELFANGCFHFPSHASGDVTFGPDGKLYASLGDGASFDTEDYGQFNGNPCGDPVDEGGALRAQDVRSSGDPLGYNGSVVRLDPDTGNPQLVAYGHRNPWRLTFRPGTSELWNGDVGASGWEEINRLVDATTVTTPVNRGWPCYEGSPSGSTRNSAWDLLDKPLCESLYAAGPSAVQAPAYSYQTRLNAGPLTPGEDCEYSTSSVSGVAFTPAGTNYPAAYQNSVFFSDYARQCIWRLSLRADGSPDPASISVFAQRAGTPVDLTAGPGGDLYYVDYGVVNGEITENAGGIHRLTYNVPIARIVTDKTEGLEPLTVQFDGTTSTDPLGGALTYAWDLDGDGQYDDSTSPTPSRTYTTRGVRTVRLRVTSGDRSGTANVEIQVGQKPTITATTPGEDLTWAVGQRIDFSGAATDFRGNAIPAENLTWRVQIEHCPSEVCHIHPLQTFPGVASGFFEAPDHEYPSYLKLILTAKDGAGLTTSRSIQLNPKTVDLTFASSPAGLPVAVAGTSGVTRQTFIVGSTFTVSAPATQQRGLFRWTFGGWSDGGGPTHQINAPAAARSYVATYLPVTSQLTLKTKAKKLKLKVDGKLRKAEYVSSLPVGTVVELVAPKKQTKKGVRYVFRTWKDTKKRKRTVTIGDAPLLLTAVYRRVRG